MCWSARFPARADPIQCSGRSHRMESSSRYLLSLACRRPARGPTVLPARHLPDGRQSGRVGGGGGDNDNNNQSRVATSRPLAAQRDTTRHNTSIAPIRAPSGSARPLNKTRPARRQQPAWPAREPIFFQLISRGESLEWRPSLALVHWRGRLVPTLRLEAKSPSCVMARVSFPARCCLAN